ncbi:SPFH domain-containing protein [Bifidobacterium crudilactis]|uniref:SPFH domain-containing protein n=1 Tax=Bifidobacterium crudilactis TaxID=327277 RepID=UPI0023567C0D|nr:SPFH domain-containing protein [Bifidobacterium crudilactis]MCI2147972.1 SPFH domain-containing protein [Bifidobacterium crudilactis]MCI2158402.1 SPFH domain-containing protein [Bifidobacterium crudilactis]
MGGQKHFVDVVKNRSANDTLVYKNPEEDFNNGSTLVVEPGEQAVFVNEGNIEQVFASGTYTLSSANYPFISRLRNALSGGVSSFHCFVYFVRVATSREMRWGTDSPVKVYDKAYADQFTGLGVETEVRVRGSYRVKVADAALFLTSLIGGNYDLNSQESLGDFFRNQFLGHIISSLTKELTDWNGPLISATSQSVVYASAIQRALIPIISEYGIEMLNFSISGMDIVDNEERREAMELVSQNRKKFFGQQAEAAGVAAYAQGQQQAYQTYGTTFQEAQVLDAMKQTAANPGSDGGSLMGAGMGLTMGAGLGQVIPGMLNTTLHAVSDNADAETPVTDAEQPAVSVSTSQESPVERLKKLKEMLDAGLISDEEFLNKKTEILKSL